jgi:hypothetical protein
LIADVVDEKRNNRAGYHSLAQLSSLSVRAMVYVC